MKSLTETILDQSTAIRTRILPEVLDRVGLIKTQFDSTNPYNTQIIDWLSPIVDLTGFHVYPTNGITEGLNWWYRGETRGVQMNLGDYQWIDPTGNHLHYQSVPSSIDGNYCQYPTDKPVALDLAYVGSTSIQKIPIHNNVERVFYSLSKSFGVRNIRTGWYFTRQEDQKLNQLTFGAKYYNYFAHDVAETIISNFTIDYVWNRLRSEQQRVCQLLNLTPSDSVFLGTSTDPIYSKFRRNNNEARVCLAGVYNYGT